MFFSLPIYQGPPRSFLRQLRTRLIVSLSALVLCLLISSALSVLVSFRQQQLGEQKVSIHDAESALLEAMLDQETGLRGYITTANTTFLAPYTSGQTTYTSELKQLQDLFDPTNFSASSTALQRFMNRANLWSTTYAEIQLANMQAGRYTQARADSEVAQGKALFDALRNAFASLQYASDQDLSALQTRATIANFSEMGVALLVIVLVVIWLWRTFSLFARVQRQYLDWLKAASEDFAQGDLSTHIRQGPDLEFNAVGETFNSMVDTLREQQQALKDRDILEQVSALQPILTASLNRTTLLKQLFQHMLTSLDLQITALYAYEPEAKQLLYVASHGIAAESIQEHFASGEGLLGRVAEERTPLLISTQNAQAASFQVRTLLGTALPASMYHLPLLHGDELLGILVVGSLAPLREPTRHVLDVMSSTLSSALYNVQSYEHIQHLADELAERSRQQEESNRALRQQRDELSVLNAALEEANRVRSQFLSTMSHELRTPLTSILGFGQMLQRGQSKNTLNERQQKNVDRILSNAQHLLSLINDVLDLSKIEAGHMDVATTRVDVEELLTSVVEETRSLALTRNLDLTLEVEEGLPYLETDARKVRQIVLNLLSNALKFTEKGFVRIQANALTLENAEQQTARQILITIRDSGIGIPLEKQAHIFDAFYQVDSSTSRNYGGTGLGLSIVRELATLLGGQITFESTPGEGTTFCLLLPQRLREQRFLEEFRLHLAPVVTPPRTEPSAQSKQIEIDSVATIRLQEGEENAPLVIAIDDNPDVLHLIAQALEQSPYRVVGVQDSTQALKVIEQLRPSAITLDIMMPQVNGWQLLYALKANPATASIPVILLTVLEDRSAGYVLGADEYLVKPVSRETLLKVLQQLISQTPEPILRTALARNIEQQERAMSSESSGKPMILLHQERDITHLLERLVNDAGYQLSATPPEQDLLPLIERTRPDLLMLVVKLEEGRHIVDEAISAMQFQDEHRNGAEAGNNSTP